LGGGSPAHPYTKALVAAIPSLDQRGVKRLRLGEPRSPIDPDPNTCRFYRRNARRSVFSDGVCRFLG
jgi:oligopeptide/dipeptide ABC transporter ATP-binding protein